MKIMIQNKPLENVNDSIITVYEDKPVSIKEVDSVKATGVFTGKEGEVFYFTTMNEEKVQYTILVGLGKMEESKGETIRCSIAKGAKKAKELKLENVVVSFMDSDTVCVGGRIKAITEGVALSLYDFNKYKSDKKEYDPAYSIVGVPQEKEAEANERLEEVKNVVEGVIIARDLVNEPSNVIYPATLADTAVKVGEESGFQVEILEETAILALGMEAFLAVGMGSENLPRLIVMRYMGDKDSSEIMGLVGKGLTYDTGGYSLKPSTSMDTMKSDMGGAAAVIGTMSALAKNKVKKNVIAVVAACENAVSGRSYKPGDIIGSMGGKTIEIDNTDAEGRLTLADAVTYIIEKENVSKVVDVATLTGAALVALGEQATAVITNDDAFYEELVGASYKTGELFWKLPTFKHYKKQIKGTLADLKNTGGRTAGTITAGLFIGEFVQGKPWLHLDVAGPAWGDKDLDYIPKGGTGVPVRTLYYLVKGPCACRR